MKGKIDSNGWLRIERGGKERLQECPFMQKAFQVNDITIAPCGDWCPMFDEPEKRPKCTYLILCHRMIEFAEFTDERVGGNDQKEGII